MSEAAKSSGQLAGEVEILLNRQVRPLLKIHGGGIDLRAVSEGGRVELEFQGACRGCPLKSVTYALGVRQKLLQLPGVREVSVRGVRLSRAALERVDQPPPTHRSPASLGSTPRRRFPAHGSGSVLYGRRCQQSSPHNRSHQLYIWQLFYRR